MSRWVKKIDGGDVRFLVGVSLLGLGFGWALAPGWGVAVVGAMVVAPNLIEWASLLVGQRQEGGEG